jgi:hypothetical protein
MRCLLVGCGLCAKCLTFDLHVVVRFSTSSRLFYWQLFHRNNMSAERRILGVPCMFPGNTELVVENLLCFISTSVIPCCRNAKEHQIRLLRRYSLLGNNRVPNRPAGVG